MPVPITLVLLTHLHLLQKSRFLSETSSTSTQQRSRNSHSNSFSSSVCIRLPTSNEAAILPLHLLQGCPLPRCCEMQDLPGAVNPGRNTFAVGYVKKKPFVVRTMYYYEAVFLLNTIIPVWILSVMLIPVFYPPLGIRFRLQCHYSQGQLGLATEHHRTELWLP